MKIKNLSGFTLIELLGVIAIIGILATFSAVSISGAVKRGRDSIRQSDLTNVKRALELYNQDEGSHPIAESEAVLSQALGTELKDYIKSLPSDVKAKDHGDYMYKSDGSGNNYVLGTKLEYDKAKQTLAKQSGGNDENAFSTCTQDQYDIEKKGNGVISDGKDACFRLTND